MYSVVDLETEIHSLFKRKASPFNPLNHVVALGYKHRNGEVVGEYYGKDRTAYKFPAIPETTKILVGFNIKFDLLWSWEQPELQAFLKRGGILWDAQYAEYLLAGQQEYAQMVAMDDIIEEYGGKLKNDEVKAFWAQGITTSDIPEDLLMDYLAGEDGDIINTERIFVQQYRKARDNGMLPAILERMEGLLATTMMEYNGIYIDKEKGLKEAANLKDKIAALDAELLQYIPSDLPPEIEFTWSNRYHLSPLLFGGKIKYQRWTQHKDENGNLMYAQKDELHYVTNEDEYVPVDRYNTDPELRATVGTPLKISSGKNAGSYVTKKLKVPDLDKPKGKQQDYFFEFEGYTTPLPQWASSTEGLYSVNAEVIEALGARDIPFLKALSSRATMNKDLTTYYIADDPKTGEQKGMLTLVGDDGIVHHQLNHNLTVTTRLSSSNPKHLGL